MTDTLLAIALRALVALVTLVAMEGVAWAVHRYVMHGWGWGWHRSHHEPHDGLLERNDLYAIFFAGIAVALILLDATTSHWFYWIGIGMSLYGVLYAVVHDGLTHQRWPFRWVPRSGYLKRLVQAHRLHHAVQGREGAVSFGFLYARPVADLRRTLRSRHGGRLTLESGE